MLIPKVSKCSVKVSGKRAVSHPRLVTPGFSLEEDFGIYVFNDQKMQSRLTADIYKRYCEARDAGVPMSTEVSDAIAQAMKDWAESHGATHFSHWFQPLTGHTAEKHDSFLGIDHKTGQSFTTFRGKLLIGGEADGSSFPSGGLRVTSQARAYTIWDPHTPAFLQMENGVPTLCIPTCFYSWDGCALDKKTPMLRSEMALEQAGVRLFRDVLGDQSHIKMHAESGVEQEFFVISRANYEKRPDLLMAKRTLQGAHPAKTQQLSDHYYAPMPGEALRFQHRVEVALWKLGIPLTTRHQEVSPNQFEWAPIFSKASVASDQNQIAMETMRRIAEDHGLEILMHEKPFARINGSGKHNNWSVGDNKTGTFFEPGPDPMNNMKFLLALGAMVRGADLRQDLLRWSVASASNDLRMGGHEAPPAIMSLYLGDYIGSLVDALIAGTKWVPPTPPGQIGIKYLPNRVPDVSDRNRTSPIAFTGNKFEFRAVGSSHTAATSNTILNICVAESFNFFADEIAKLKAKGASNEDAIRAVVTEALRNHKRIIYNGNGYSAEWHAEAKRRGLRNLGTTADVLEAIKTEENMQLFERFKVLNRREFESFVCVDLENYITTCQLEAEALIMLANRYIIPASIQYQNDLLRNTDSVPSRMREELRNYIDRADAATRHLKASVTELGNQSNLNDTAKFAANVVLERMSECRKYLDLLEDVVGQSYWPIPTYEQILLTRHKRPTQHIKIE